MSSLLSMLLLSGDNIIAEPTQEDENGVWLKNPVKVMHESTDEGEVTYGRSLLTGSGDNEEIFMSFSSLLTFSSVSDSFFIKFYGGCLMNLAIEKARRDVSSMESAIADSELKKINAKLLVYAKELQHKYGIELPSSEETAKEASTHKPSNMVH